MLHSPYVYDLIQRLSFRNYAHPVKDRYSVGIVIFEILAGSDLVLAAKGWEEVEEGQGEGVHGAEAQSVYHEFAFAYEWN